MLNLFEQKEYSLNLTPKNAASNLFTLFTTPLRLGNSGLKLLLQRDSLSVVISI